MNKSYHNAVSPINSNIFRVSPRSFITFAFLSINRTVHLNVYLNIIYVCILTYRENNNNLTKIYEFDGITI